MLTTIGKWNAESSGDYRGARETTNELVVLITACAAALLLFALFYPPIYSSLDEAEYLAFARVLSHGTLFFDAAGLSPGPMSLTNSDGHVVSYYRPGNSLLLVPFVVIADAAVFLRGPILLIAGTVAFYLSLLSMRQRHAALWSLLYLFFPSFIIQSRTLLSDLPVTVVSTMATLCLFRGANLAAGLLWGVAFLCRPTIALIFLPFAIGLFLRQPRNSAWTMLVAGLIPFGVLYLASNTLAYGGPLSVPESIVSAASFGVANVWRNLPLYTLSLLLIYPLLLFGVISYRGPKRIEVTLAVFAIILFHLFYIYQQEWDNPLEQLVIGNRFLLPAVPLLLLGYPRLLELIWEGLTRRFTLWQHWSLWRLAPIVVVPMLVLYGLVSLRHQRFLVGLAHYRDELYAATGDYGVVLLNGDLRKLVALNPGARSFYGYSFMDRCIQVDQEIAEAYEAGRPVYTAALLRPFKAYVDMERRCLDLILAEQEGELVHDEEQPYPFVVYRLHSPAAATVR